jgi:hypothetical protein
MQHGAYAPRTLRTGVSQLALLMTTALAVELN